DELCLSKVISHVNDIENSQIFVSSARFKCGGDRIFSISTTTYDRFGSLLIRIPMPLTECPTVEQARISEIAPRHFTRSQGPTPYTTERQRPIKQPQELIRTIVFNDAG